MALSPLHLLLHLKVSCASVRPCNLLNDCSDQWSRRSHIGLYVKQWSMHMSVSSISYLEKVLLLTLAAFTEQNLHFWPKASLSRTRTAWQGHPTHICALHLKLHMKTPQLQLHPRSLLADHMCPFLPHSLCRSSGIRSSSKAAPAASGAGCWHTLPI